VIYRQEGQAFFDTTFIYV